MVSINCTNIVARSKSPVLSSAHSKGVLPNKSSFFGKTVKSILPKISVVSKSANQSAPTLFFTTDVLTYIKESPRFAATGLNNNSAIVVTRKLFGGGDWDPFYFYTSNITIGAPVFNFGYANSSSDTTLGDSVVATYRSNGSYLFAFKEKLGQFKSGVYIRPFTNGELGVFSTLTQVNNPLTNPGSNLNGLVDAGFRNVNNDSCLTIL